MGELKLREDIEYIVHCDESGEVIGPISKKHAHISEVRKTLIHYSTWSMVYNPFLEKYGLQLKNSKKDDKNTAGKWDMGVAGHNCYELIDNEYIPLNFEDNFIKEAKEEIGIDVKMFKDKFSFINQIRSIGNFGFLFDNFLYETETDREYVGLILLVTNQENFDYLDGEVVDFKWFSEAELEEFLLNEKGKYCSGLPLVFEKTKIFVKNNL